MQNELASAARIIPFSSKVSRCGRPDLADLGARTTAIRRSAVAAGCAL
jgi:hypothetical protein